VPFRGWWRSVTETICEVIITADDAEWLLNFTRQLIEDRLAACGQHSKKPKPESPSIPANPSYLRFSRG